MKILHSPLSGLHILLSIPSYVCSLHAQRWGKRDDGTGHRERQILGDLITRSTDLSSRLDTRSYKRVSTGSSAVPCSVNHSIVSSVFDGEFKVLMFQVPFELESQAWHADRCHMVSLPVVRAIWVSGKNCSPLKAAIESFTGLLFHNCNIGVRNDRCVVGFA